MSLKLFGSFEGQGEEVDLRIWIWIEELNLRILIFFLSTSPSRVDVFFS
jgi:hypothetical protein